MNVQMRTPVVSRDESEAQGAFESLIDAYPQHQTMLQSCMWTRLEIMLDGSRIHHFEHIETGNRFTFRPNPNGAIGGTVIGLIETGEESADADAVLGLIGRL